LAKHRRDLRPLETSDFELLSEILQSLLKLTFKPRVLAVPSLAFTPAIKGVTERWHPTDKDTIVVTLEPLDVVQATELREKAHGTDVRVGVDLPIAPADVWSPQEASFPLLAQLDLALAQIGASAAATKGALGKDVTVVIVDQGINYPVLAKRLGFANFVGGFIVDENARGGPYGLPNLVQPGTWPDGHATRMAEMVLSVAPSANIFDLPLLPSDILNLQTYLSWAAAAYAALDSLIAWLYNLSQFTGPWVLCNAWAVYDLRDDVPLPSPFNYALTPSHPLNYAVSSLPGNQTQPVDIAFAAGNCGQFFPDPRCGEGQIGPGRSIYGVAALDGVLSLSAVRSDQIWLGYSSQGPAPPIFNSTKPDLCAPSQFAGPADWATAYTGTSTACALTAGALAAARSYPTTMALSSPAMRAHAIATASALVHEKVPNERLGAGLLNVDALLP
jgi:hypothetical protein